ncbi:MAG: hypothetical protein ACI92S_004839 [Planctomycetaceae bacterium]|jgi:hypothetical protein
MMCNTDSHLTRRAGVVVRKLTSASYGPDFRGVTDRLHPLKRRLPRLQHNAELERTTGKPLELTPEDRQRLAEKAAGIDPETLRQICVFDPAELIAPDQEPDSTENR